MRQIVCFAKIIDRISRTFFPRKCLACGAFLEDSECDFCKLCAEHIERIKPPYCRYCYRSLEDCKCNHHFLAYDGAAAPFYYDGSIRQAILRLKFSSKENVAVFLGREMSVEINALFFGVRFDILTCVPTTKRSLAERGFNQSQSLAEQIELEPSLCPINEPLIRDYHLLKKSKATQVQHLLSAEKRRKNIETAYHMNEYRDVRGKTVLIIDDILTTGATLESCSRELLLAGATHVYVATAAVAPQNKASE